MTMKSVAAFTAIEHCPYCKYIAVHDLRPPNLEPPKVILRGEDQEAVTAMSFNGLVSVVYIPEDLYDHEDERDFEVVKICVDCSQEWGVMRHGNTHAA